MENAIFKRRSIRSFDGKPVEAEKIDRILRAGMQAPSAHNKQPWEFLVVTDEEKKEALSQMSPYAGMVANAPVAIVVIGNPNPMSEDYLAQDLSACTQNILLQITEEGLGGCWMGFYPNEQRIQSVRDYFSIPENRIPFSVIALGYSNRENTFVDRYDKTKVHYNQW